MPLLKVDQSKQPMVVFIAILIIVGSLTSIFLTQCRRPSVRIDYTPHVMAAEVLAKETAQLLGNKGAIVLLVSSLQSGTSEFHDRQLKAFQSALSKQGSITVAATEAPKWSDEEASQMLGVFPARDYLRVLEAYPNVNAIASLVGIPDLSDKQIRSLPSRIPICTAISHSENNRLLKKLLREEIVQCAIVSRYEPLPAGASRGASPEDAFNRKYQVVTAETAASLPD